MIQVSSPRGVHHRLRRDGAPPLHFVGRRLVYGSGCGPTGILNARAWHDVTLYETELFNFVVEIILVLKSFDGSKRISFHSASFAESLQNALSFIENYQPIKDLYPGVTLPLLSVPNDEQAFSDVTVALEEIFRARHNIELQYKKMVGKLLLSVAEFFV
jgi:hypothetical protein